MVLILDIHDNVPALHAYPILASPLTVATRRKIFLFCMPSTPGMAYSKTLDNLPARSCAYASIGRGSGALTRDPPTLTSNTHPVSRRFFSWCWLILILVCLTGLRSPSSSHPPLPRSPSCFLAPASYDLPAAFIR